MDRHSTRPGRARQGLRPAAGGRHATDDLLARAAALFPESRRWCPSCEAPVGRARDGRPGRLRGTCAHCRHVFDLAPELAPGTVLGGRWTITGPLARGGDWLYTADDGERGGSVVVARRRDDDAATPARLLGHGHPALVGLRDVVTTADAVHLVLEPVHGGPARGPLSPDDAAALVLGVIPAVGHLHGLGLLHADLKPSNVLRAPDGPVLVDLGSVRRLDDRIAPVWGTEGFLAPEIAPGGAGPSVASEVYALGRTLAVLLGRPVRPHLAPRRPVEDPTPLDPVITRATAADPGLRHADVAALGTDLLAALGVGGTDTADAVHQDDPSRPAAPAPAHAPRGAFPT
ncbi:hypothetical protein LQ327_07865 [Actinomycetospora endophytica]|uniref:non-specific serine/threonine protein kinase n=1 Tax=Actinomycetospora endophytica TaxID=2291215 RepID=A0ABS8P7B6_9PSEU|nr:serine/threonine protein kinase [Actinomycetospora endophytica]MCD2193301.1 hypothetical protein [Actinomycetospora endophytica]